MDVLSPRRERVLIALAAGVFLGAALFDAYPEASDALGDVPAAFWIGVGFCLWWLQKRLLRRFHRPDLPPLVASALWFHSVLEGIVTGLAFGVSRNAGIAVLAAMTLHLLPEFFAAMALMRGAGAGTRGSLVVTFAGFAVLYGSSGLTYASLPRLGISLPVLIALSGGAFAYVGAVSFWRTKPLAPGSGRGLVAFLAGMLVAAVFR